MLQNKHKEAAHRIYMCFLPHKIPKQLHNVSLILASNTHSTLNNENNDFRNILI